MSAMTIPKQNAGVIFYKFMQKNIIEQNTLLRAKEAVREKIEDCRALYFTETKLEKELVAKLQEVLSVLQNLLNALDEESKKGSDAREIKIGAEYYNPRTDESGVVKLIEKDQIKFTDGFYAQRKNFLKDWEEKASSEPNKQEPSEDVTDKNVAELLEYHCQQQRKREVDLEKLKAAKNALENGKRRSLQNRIDSDVCEAIELIIEVLEGKTK